MNGSIGKITGFMTTREAKEKGIKIGIADMPTKPGPDHRNMPGSPAKPGSNQLLERMLRRSDVWPVVRFNRGAYDGGPIQVLCVPNVFEVNNAEGNIEASREQVSQSVLSWRDPSST